VGIAGAIPRFIRNPRTDVQDADGCNVGFAPARLSFIHCIKTGSKQPGSSCEYAVALYAQLDQPLLSLECPDALMHPVPFIVIGLLLFRFRKGKQIYQAAGLIGAAMATLFFVLPAVSLVPNFVELCHTHTSGNSSVAEGVVENFKPVPT